MEPIVEPSVISFILFSGKMSLAEICENAKMAREYALLGNYDTSLVYYQGVIQQIQKHIQQLKDDAIMKQEWHQVNTNIIEDIIKNVVLAHGLSLLHNRLSCNHSRCSDNQSFGTGDLERELPT